MGWVALNGEDEGIEGLHNDPTGGRHFEADHFLAFEVARLDGVSPRHSIFARELEGDRFETRIRLPQANRT